MSVGDRIKTLIRSLVPAMASGGDQDWRWRNILGDAEGMKTEAVFEKILSRISASGQGSFVTVLKKFGDLPSPGLMSFPRAGVNLALDFSNRGKLTLDLLDELDELVVGAGGAVYPAKDARMSAQSFQSYYPKWKEFARFVDPGFSSSFWRRVTAGAAP